MRVTSILFAALAVAAAFDPTWAQERDLSGDYAMKGTSLRPNSRGYEGDCTLKRHDKVYKVNCVNSGSGDKYAGTGILRRNQFSLYLGEYLVVYDVAPDGSLSGNWAHARSDDYGEEALTPKRQ